MSKGSLAHLSGAPYFGGVIASGFGVGQPVGSGKAPRSRPTINTWVLSGWNATQFSVFQTGSGGSLTPVKGSPFGFGDLSPAQVIPSADGKFIFFAEDTGDPSVLSGVGVLAIDGTGALTQIAGSPFRNPKASFVGGNNAVAAFPPKVCQAAGPAVSSVSPQPDQFERHAQRFGVADGDHQQHRQRDTQYPKSAGVGKIPVAISPVVSQPRPGSSCQITVSYNPATTTAVTGSLTIKDDAPDSPQAIPINGNASAGAVLSANPSNLSFAGLAGQGGTSQNVTLTNTLRISSLIIADSSVRDISSGFNLDLTNCLAKTLQAGQSCTLPCDFVPWDIARDQQHGNQRQQYRNAESAGGAISPVSRQPLWARAFRCRPP